jgi:hypothetical protein
MPKPRSVYFFGASGAGAAGVAGAAAGAMAGAAGAETVIALMKSSYVEDLPPCTTAIGSTLPLFSAKIVISAFLRSPFSSNSILPVAPL